MSREMSGARPPLRPDLTIVALAPAASQPRYHKRAEQLSREGNVVVFAFERGYYEINTFPSQIPTVSLGRIANRRYLQRLFHLVRAWRTVRRRVAGKTPCVYYAFSLDCLLLARCCGIRHGYYEVGDLRQVEGPRGLWTLLQKLVLGDIRGLVLTSRFFADYFSRLLPALPRERIVVIDNKVHRDLAGCRPGRKTFSDGRIVIGIIGLLRYRRPLELLLEYVRARPDTHAIECFGDGPLRDLVVSAQCDHIRYHGSFKNPDALPEIYSRVDLNYVVYDNASENVRLALPNKLYESAFFGVPILCCDRTRLGELAMAWGIGKTIRIGDPQAFFEDMDAIDHAWLLAKSAQGLKIPPEELLDDGDAVIGRLFGRTEPAT